MESVFREFFGSTPGLIHSKKLLDEILSYNEEGPDPDDRFMALMIALCRSERNNVARRRMNSVENQAAARYD